MIFYTPEDGFSGNDSFVISFDDQQGNIVEKTVIVVIAEVVPPETNTTTPTSTPVDLTVATVTRIISSVSNTQTSKDEATQEITVSAEVNADEDDYIYKAIVITDKEGKSRTQIIKIRISDGKETIVENTLKNLQRYGRGSRIELFLIGNKLRIKTTTIVDEPLIIE